MSESIGLDLAAEVKHFLVSRRRTLSPADVGLPSNSKRRTHGLSQDEVAVLASVSSEYYRRIENKGLRGVSVSVVNAICEALRLNNVERIHLYRLNFAANFHPIAHPQTTMPSSLSWIVDSLQDCAAIVQTRNFDLVAANPLGHALSYPLIHSSHAEPVNLGRFWFLDPRAAVLSPEWERFAVRLAGLMRFEICRDPQNGQLLTLINDLQRESKSFAALWDAYVLYEYLPIKMTLNHPIVGHIGVECDYWIPPWMPGFILMLVWPVAERRSQAAFSQLTRSSDPSTDL